LCVPDMYLESKWRCSRLTAPYCSVSVCGSEYCWSACTVLCHFSRHLTS